MNESMEIEAFIEKWNMETIRLLDISCRRLEEGHYIAAAALPSPLFLFVAQGKGRLLLNGAAYSLNSFYIVHANRHSRLRLTADEGLQYYMISYADHPSRSSSGKQQEAPPEPEFGFAPARPLALHQLASALYSQWQRLERLEQLRVQSLFYSFVHEALTQWKYAAKEASPPDRVLLALEHMRQCYREPLTLDQVAATAGCSTRRLAQLFAHRFGMSPAQVLSALRMHKAAQLLRQTDANLQAIAEQVGYGSGYSLSRQFKKNYLLSPEQYRKEAEQEQTAAPSPASGPFPTGLQALLEDWTSRPTAVEQTCGHGLRQSQRHASPAFAADKPASVVLKPPGPTRSIRTVAGEITVPARPRRVVVDWNIGHLLALGLAPVGVPGSLLDNSKLLDPYWPEAPADIGFHNHISYESVMALEPDLIVTWNRNAYPAYARIAPTVVFEAERFGGMNEEIWAMGQIVNRQREAAAWIADSRRRVLALRARMAARVSAASTFTLVDPCWQSEVTIIGNTACRGGKAVYERLGLKPAPGVARDILDKGLDSVQIAKSRVDAYLGDCALVMTYDPSLGLTASPGWNPEEIARRRRIVELPWSQYFQSDPFSSLLQAEELAGRL